MNRKSQITLFFIIGLVIIIIFSLSIWFYSNYNTNTHSDQVPSLNEDMSLRTTFDYCLEKVAQDAILDIGKKGFYYEIPEELETSDKSIWVLKNVNLIPSEVRFIEIQIQNYIDDYYESCIPLQELHNRGLDVTDYEINSYVNMNREDISFSVNYNLIDSDHNILSLNKSTYILPYNFYRIYNESISFVNDHLLSNDFNLQKPLENFAYQGYVVDHHKIDDYTYEFKITDISGSLVGDHNFEVTFIANFAPNDLERQYVENVKTIYSPDMALKLILPYASEIPISIRNYERDSIIRNHTLSSKTNGDVNSWKDLEIETSLPIYRFGPNGYEFDMNAGLLFLNLNRFINVTSDIGLWHNGKNGWTPYIFEYDEEKNKLKSPLFGFSEYVPITCLGKSAQSFSVTAEEERSTFSIYTFYVIYGLNYYLDIDQPLITALGAALISPMNAVEAYYAYKAATEDLDTEKTISFKPFCDTNVNIELKKQDGGECTCLLNGDEVQGAHQVEGGKTYFLTAALEDFEWPETEATCTCEVTGHITTDVDGYDYEKAKEEVLEDPEPWNLPNSSFYDPDNRYNKSSNIVFQKSQEFLDTIIQMTKKDLVHADHTNVFNLGCCISTDNYCFENYLERYCFGNQQYRSCNDIPQCPSYTNYSEFLRRDVNPPTLDGCTYLQGSEEPELDIIISGLDYTDKNTYLSDVQNMVIQLSKNENYKSFNIYRMDDIINSSENSSLNIADLSREKCQGIADETIHILLQENYIPCHQNFNIIKMHNLFTLKEDVQTISSQRLRLGFCDFVHELETQNPPRPVIHKILTQDGEARIFFSIEDEKSPVSYAIYGKDATFNTSEGIEIPNTSGIADAGEEIVKIVQIPDYPGKMTFYVKAEDIQGKLFNSNEDTVVVPGILFNFEQYNPFYLDDVFTLNANNFITLYDAGEIIEREYSSSNIGCVKVFAQEAGGYFDLVKQSDYCSSNITIRIKTDEDYTGNGTFEVISN